MAQRPEGEASQTPNPTQSLSHHIYGFRHYTVISSATMRHCFTSLLMDFFIRNLLNIFVLPEGEKQVDMPTPELEQFHWKGQFLNQAS